MSHVLSLWGEVAGISAMSGTFLVLIFLMSLRKLAGIPELLTIGEPQQAASATLFSTAALGFSSWCKVLHARMHQVSQTRVGAVASRMRDQLWTTQCLCSRTHRSLCSRRMRMAHRYTSSRRLLHTCLIIFGRTYAITNGLFPRNGMLYGGLLRRAGCVLRWSYLKQAETCYAVIRGSSVRLVQTLHGKCSCFSTWTVLLLPESVQ